MNATEIKPGMTFYVYYGNGQKCGKTTVTRVNEKSIFDTPYNREFRQSIKTVQGYLDRGIWKLIK